MQYFHLLCTNCESAHCMWTHAYCLWSHLCEKWSHSINGPLWYHFECMCPGCDLNTINLMCQPPTRAFAPPRTQNSFAAMMSRPLAIASFRDSTNWWRLWYASSTRALCTTKPWLVTRPIPRVRWTPATIFLTTQLASATIRPALWQNMYLRQSFSGQELRSCNRNKRCGEWATNWMQI